jgi:hypothetical protein
MDKNYVNRLIEMNKNSGRFIDGSGIKNRHLYPYLPTMVFDNFYEDPVLVRNFALDQNFFKGERGSWPGLRTDLLHTVNREFFEMFMRKLLIILKDYEFTEFLELQTGFQIIEESYGQGWVHDDDPKLNVAGLIYLNPHSPLGAGTVIYEDQTDFNGDLYTEIFMNDVLLASPEERSQYDKYRKEQISHFTPTVTVESVYNRCVIFDPRNWHSAENFFGHDVETGRLTQVFFARAI